jgi:hypothetical protein
MRTTLRPRAAGLAVVWLVLAAPASAQQGGVFVDPDSPAGKEYAIPIEQARRQASGSPGGSAAEPGGRAAQAPLFGAGITREGASGGGGSSGAGSDTSGREANGNSTGSKRDGSTPKGKSGNSTGVAANPGAAAVEASIDEGSTGLLTAGIAAGVLGLGLLFGFGLRRSLRND